MSCNSYHTHLLTSQAPGKQARKMLHQFAILLLATIILGITGSTHDDNTLEKTLSPILFGKSLAIVIYSSRLSFFQPVYSYFQLLSNAFVTIIAVTGFGGSRLYIQDTSDGHCNTNGEAIRIWINTTHVENAPDCYVKQFT